MAALLPPTEIVPLQLDNSVSTKLSENNISSVKIRDDDQKPVNLCKEEFPASSTNLCISNSLEVSTDSQTARSADNEAWNQAYKEISPNYFEYTNEETFPLADSHQISNSHKHINRKHNKQIGIRLGTIPLRNTITEGRTDIKNIHGITSTKSKARNLAADQADSNHNQKHAYGTISAVANMALEPEYLESYADTLALPSYYSNKADDFNSYQRHGEKSEQFWYEPSQNTTYLEKVMLSPPSSSALSIDMELTDFLENKDKPDKMNHEAVPDNMVYNGKYQTILDCQFKHEKKQDRILLRKSLKQSQQYPKDSCGESKLFGSKTHSMKYDYNNSVLKQRQEYTNKKGDNQRKKKESKHKGGLIACGKQLSRQECNFGRLFFDPSGRNCRNLASEAQTNESLNGTTLSSKPNRILHQQKTSSLHSSIMLSSQAEKQLTEKQNHERDVSYKEMNAKHSQSLRSSHNSTVKLLNDTRSTEILPKSLKISKDVCKSSSLKRPHTNLFRSNSTGKLLSSPSTSKLSRPVFASATQSTPLFNSAKLARIKLTRNKLSSTSSPDLPDLRNVSFSISETGRAIVDPEETLAILKRTKNNYLTSTGNTASLSSRSLKPRAACKINSNIDGNISARSLPSSFPPEEGSGSGPTKVPSRSSKALRSVLTSKLMTMPVTSKPKPLVECVSLTTRQNSKLVRLNSIRQHASSSSSSILSSWPIPNTKPGINGKNSENRISNSFNNSNNQTTATKVDPIDSQTGDDTTDASIAVAKILARKRDHNNYNYNDNNQNNDVNNKNDEKSINYTQFLPNKSLGSPQSRDIFNSINASELLQNFQPQGGNYNANNNSSNLSPRMQSESLSLQDINTSLFPGSLTPSMPSSIFYNQSPSAVALENMGFLNTNDIGLGMVMPPPLGSDSLFLSDMSMSMVDISDDLMAIINTPFGNNDYNEVINEDRKISHDGL
ncbi:hypothetical protein NADFUDRAFT_67104 [Nadsonia fulvescens var. elongata DSM 6958]|uniref:Uncharacterized protein n=1 Tax=Nadsonia fulvescens var. elongata DSM 6958 TaxID=857566 RepID=A0A1E3PG36_9ASCO|nr:hypothetical protein NADFUDRAFT_67104 [Nadsonia fulvescens var. elongata DSM 6958]